MQGAQECGNILGSFLDKSSSLGNLCVFHCNEKAFNPQSGISAPFIFPISL